MKKICTEDLCRLPFGKCINNVCQCFSGYVNIRKFSNGSSNLYCKYKQKYFKIALILECSTLFGIGHLYAHHMNLFFTKIIFFIILFILRVNLFWNENDECKLTNFISKLYYYFFLMIFLVYHVIDILILYNYGFTDGYGVQMLV